MDQKDIFVMTAEDIDRIESLLASTQMAINELCEARQITIESLPYLDSEQSSYSESDKIVRDSLGSKLPEKELF